MHHYSGVAERIRTIISSALHGARTLVFPELCIMCRREFVEICLSCKSRWFAPAEQLRFSVAPTYSVIPYSEDVSAIVLLAKEERNKVAQSLIAQALHQSITQLLERTATESCLLIPVPSSRQAIRKRGESFLHPILNRVISLQRATRKSSNPQWIWQELLRHTRRVRDQASLSPVARASNMESVFSVIAQTESHSKGLSSGIFDLPIVVVDDVITTGATLKNAIEALREGKMTVLGAATACASTHQFLIR